MSTRSSRSDDLAPGKLFELAELRMNEMSRVGPVLSGAARRGKIVATVVRVAVVILGALVATRGVAEQFEAGFISRSSVRMAIVMAYTFVGVLISALGGLELAFKFSDRSSALVVLAADAWNLSRQYMSDIAVGSGDPASLRRLIARQNRDLERIHQQAAKLGVILVSQLTEDGIDYSHA